MFTTMCSVWDRLEPAIEPLGQQAVYYFQDLYALSKLILRSRPGRSCGVPGAAPASLL